MKTTYADQLKHPKWQKRRLEILNKAGFKCGKCGAEEKTLNVHHKQYFKGRMIWDYADEELSCLCEDCHQDEHKAEDITKKLICQMSGNELLSLLCGYLVVHQSSADPEIRRAPVDKKVLKLGVIAHALGQMTDKEVSQVFQSMLANVDADSDAAITLFLSSHLFENQQ